MSDKKSSRHAPHAVRSIRVDANSKAQSSIYVPPHELTKSEIDGGAAVERD